MTWFHPAGTLRTDDADVLVTPDLAPWTYSGLRVVTLRPGVPVEVTLEEDEGVLVPLSAQDVRVTVDGETVLLAGREGVFAAVSDWIYVPLGAVLTIAARAARWPCALRGPRFGTPSRTCGPRTCRSRCAAPGDPPGRSPTSPPRGPSPARTGSTCARSSRPAATGRRGRRTAMTASASAR